MDHTGSTYNYSNPSASLSIYGTRRQPQPQVVSYHGPQMVQQQVGSQNANDRLIPKDVFKEKKKKKKNEEIEGETVPELVNNIIIEKPNLKILRKAFRKIVDIAEEEKEANLIF